MTDLIVGVVQNYDWNCLRAYAVSLTRTGFPGTKMLFVRNITDDAYGRLANMGFTLVNFEYNEPDGFIIRGRYKPVVDFLATHHQDYRYVIWTDVRDVVFQNDPAAWVHKNIGAYNLLAAKECWKIKDENWNNVWAQQTVSAQDYKWLREEEACCGGTLAGEADAMRFLMRDMHKMVSESQAANDQAALNFLLRNTPYEQTTKIPAMNEGFAVMCAAFHTPSFNSYVAASIPLTDAEPVFDKENGMVYAPGSMNVPFSIVHQYDRDSSWASIIGGKYQ